MCDDRNTRIRMALGGRSTHYSLAIEGSHLMLGIGTGQVLHTLRRDSAGEWRPQQTVYGDLNSGFRSSVAMYGTRMVVGADRDNSDVPLAGAAYVLEQDEAGVWVQVQKLTAEVGSGGANFGFAVAIGEDFIAVGSPGDDGQALDAGAVHTFVLGPDGRWFQDQKLVAVDAKSLEGFGYSVAWAGDLLAVGAPF